MISTANKATALDAAMTRVCSVLYAFAPARVSGIVRRTRTMNILKSIAFALLVLAVGCSTPRQQPLSEAALRQRIARVHPGMLRSEVAPLFPAFSEPRAVILDDGSTRRRATIVDDGAVISLSGGAQIYHYRVSPEWAVDVQYDYSTPEPKVSGPVTLRKVSK